MHVWNVWHAARWKYRTQKSPFWHHRTTLSGCIFAAETCIDNRKKNLLNTDTSSTCPHNMVNFGLLTAEMLASLGHPCKFQQLSRLGSVTARHSSSGHQPNLAALNRGRHLYLAGRPSRWALVHILVIQCVCPHGPTKTDLPWLFPIFPDHFANSLAFPGFPGERLILWHYWNKWRKNWRQTGSPRKWPLKLWW